MIVPQVLSRVAQQLREVQVREIAAGSLLTRIDSRGTISNSLNYIDTYRSETNISSLLQSLSCHFVTNCTTEGNILLQKIHFKIIFIHSITLKTSFYYHSSCQQNQDCIFATGIRFYAKIWDFTFNLKSRLVFKHL